MGTIWVKELTGGLDTRRMPETTPGGVLIRGDNGHITSGGEFEQRAAFVPFTTLPPDTFGLAHTSAGLYVFGSEAAPALAPGVFFQQLLHPDGTTALAAVVDVDLYAGKLYVVADFADGSRYHFFDGTRVTSWYDSKARAAFTVTAGQVAAIASASFDVISGGAGDTMTFLKVDGVNILNGTITWATSNTATATAIKNSINAATTSPEYTATSSGHTVTITPTSAGDGPNGRSVVATVTGDFAISPSSGLVLSGGAETSQMSDLTIDGISVLDGPIVWADSNSAVATAIAAAINTKVSAPEYDATAVDNVVNIAANVAGAAPNGKVVKATLKDGFTINPDTALEMAGGSDTLIPFASFVKTIQSKVYGVSGSNLMFSGIAEPTKWTTDVTGAGFIDISSEEAGSETLYAVARYQDFLAIFAESQIQIWVFDPDPTLNRVRQSLDNTGTTSPLSVTQFGDTDVFYLDESGLRSLRARDSSNAAATTDIGSPVDTLIRPKLQSIDPVDRGRIIGLINPADGRFWLIMLDQIFVFSFFANSKVSAWTTYAASTIDADGDTVSFEIDAATIFNRRVYVRSGDAIYAYGGTGATLAYDATVAEAWLPYFDANKPTMPKDWTAVDAAVEGAWQVYSAMQPTNLDASDLVASITRTTFNAPSIGSLGRSTHISLRFLSQGVGPHKLSSAVIHYTGGGDED